MNARNRVRGVIGMSTVNRAFNVPKRASGGDDEGLERPSLAEERAALSNAESRRGVSAVSAISAFKAKPRGAGLTPTAASATSRTPRSLPTVEEDALP